MSFCCECPNCGHLIIQCEVPGCEEVAEHEGYFADVGALSGLRVKVCNDHKELLRGAENES